MLGILGRTLLSVFYSEVEVVGMENFPQSGGAIIVGNHNNSLVDGVIFASILPRMPRFLAASTVWDYTPIVPLLAAAGVVPLYRRQDGREQDGDTAQSLAAAAQLLAAGGILAIFPEGKSHNEAALLPIKSGTARIALQAEREHGPLGLKIVPVGITFEAKQQFRSRVLIEIGAPLEVDADNVSVNDIKARALTDRISNGLESVTPNYQSWEEAQMIEQAADMWSQTHSDLPNQTSIKETAKMRHAFRQGYATLQDTRPDLIAQIGTDVADYIRLLKQSGLRDEQVGASYPHGVIFWSSLRAVAILMVRLPLTALGALFNGIPFYFLLWLSRRQDLDKRATWSVFAGLFLFPAFWVICASVTGWIIGTWYGIGIGLLTVLGVLITAPFTGLFAIKSRETRKRATQNLRAWYLLRINNKGAPQLIKKRNLLRAHLSELWDTVFGTKP
jgi:1-acyl-sn-glycerol-3-phosphate acyltransferase